MGVFKIIENDFKTVNVDNKTVKILKKSSFDKFNTDLLGLGKIETKSKPINALSVMFDLEGFTTFCKQIDPQLAVPEYLSEFLNWIFDEVKSELTEKIFEEGYRMWTDFPFLIKYLGDGLLFLWDTENMSEVKIGNVVICMHNVCNHYRKLFLPEIIKSIITPPTNLRCGIARGAIYSVGNGEDYVGPCINMSARLQKLNSLSFCFSRRGINPEKFPKESKAVFLTKKTEIRGIGSEELIVCLKKEFDNLSKADKESFKDV